MAGLYDDAFIETLRQGAESLAPAWGLSPELAEFARCHHQYQLAQRQPQAAKMLALANLLSSLEDTAEADSDPLIQQLLAQLELGQSALAEVVEQGEQQCLEVKNIILG